MVVARSILLSILGAVAAEPCPQGFDNYLPTPDMTPAAKCYQLAQGAKTWEQCRQACQDLGGRQLCVRSQMESEFARDIAHMNSRCCTWNDKSCCTWIGLFQADPSQGAAKCAGLWSPAAHRGEVERRP